MKKPIFVFAALFLTSAYLSAEAPDCLPPEKQEPGYHCFWTSCGPVICFEFENGTTEEEQVDFRNTIRNFSHRAAVTVFPFRDIELHTRFYYLSETRKGYRKVGLPFWDIKATYNVTPRFSVYCRLNNLLGTREDRKFSYSKLDAVLNNNNPVQEQQQTTVPKEISSNPLENIASGAADIVSGLGGLFDIQPSSSAADEVEDLRQQAIKKKKKPQKRRGFRQ